jgi:peroxiredoxin
MLAAAPQAAAPAAQAATSVKLMTVADFTLKDANGKTHQLYKLADKAAIVIAMQGVGCPIVLKMTPDIKAVAAKYTAKNVEFLMVNSNPQDTPEMIAAEAKDFEQPIPILKDTDQKVGKALGAKRTAEMYIIQPKTWQVLYHGPIDDRLSYGQEKAVATKHYLSDALDEVLASKPVTVEQTQANGCLINFS